MRRLRVKAVCACAVLICVVGVVFALIVLPAKESENAGMPSSSLQTVTTKVGNARRTDYVDSNNVITYASDKRYASVIKTVDGLTTKTEYLDQHGLPARQKKGHYAQLTERNEHGQVFRITYLDAKGNPTVISSGYAIVERTYDDMGRIHMERYLDANEKPTESKSYGYGFVNGYDVDGEKAVTLYMDEKGEPREIKRGYAIRVRTFCKTDDASNGKVAYEYYQDAWGSPVTLSSGYSALHKEYDDQGNNVVLTYLGPDGLPIMTKLGYASVHKTYENGKVREEKYYDENGNPIALANGQYGLRYVDGETFYLDENGREYYNLKKYLYAHPLFVVGCATLILFIALVVSRRTNVLLLVLYVGFIIYMTLSYRMSTRSRANLELFWSYSQFFTSESLRQEIIFNILLFVPFGAILYRVRPQHRVILVALAATLIIETLQYVWGIGLCELDDVFSNVLGAAIGIQIMYICRKYVDTNEELLRLPWFFRSKPK